ncbi:MAG: hypothetical protein OYH77_01155 [Pseudomonadota bacterium]|nr:hypothetical protein [Pseudomonadota bacterium]
MRSVLALVVCLSMSSHSKASTINLQLKQQELRTMLKTILVDNFGIDGVEMHVVDSDTTFAIQVYYPDEHSNKIVGQAGGVVRSIKILFNEMYLALQQRKAEANKEKFDLEEAKKLYIKFIPSTSE